jgi:hypothetical protein
MAGYVSILNLPMRRAEAKRKLESVTNTFSQARGGVLLVACCMAAGCAELVLCVVCCSRSSMAWRLHSGPHQQPAAAGSGSAASMPLLTPSLLTPPLLPRLLFLLPLTRAGDPEQDVC